MYYSNVPYSLGAISHLIILALICALPNMQAKAQRSIMSESQITTGLLTQANDSAKITFCKSLAFSQELDCFNQLISTQINKDSLSTQIIARARMINLYIIKGQPEVASLHLDTSFAMARELNEPRLLSLCNHQKGFINQRIGNSQNALEYFYKAQEINEKNNFEVPVYKTRIKLIRFFIQLKEYNKARAELKKLEWSSIHEYNGVYGMNLGLYFLATEQLDSAVVVFQKFYNYCLEENKSSVRALAYLRYSKCETQLAINILADHVSSADSTRVLDHTIVKTRLAKWHIELQQYEEAKALLVDLLDITEERKDFYNFNVASELLLIVYEKEKEYKNAWLLNRRQEAYIDRMKDVQKKEIVYALEQEHQAQVREREIANLQISQIKQAAKSKFQNRMILFLCVGVLALLFILASMMRLNKVKNKIQSELSETNSKLTQSNNDKDILLKEIHHRVKNNLQIVSSLLNLQKRFIKDPKAAEAVQMSRNRVKSIALLHQQLYDKEDVRSINIRTYITKLCQNIEEAFREKADQVDMILNLDEFNVDIDSGTPIGLIVNELLTNAMKHAHFEEGTQGQIEVTITQNNDMIVLSVADDGMVKESSPREDSVRFGHQLIRSLAKKLKAEVIISTDNGYKVTLLIKRFSIIPST